jgi:hypothetical protein
VRVRILKIASTAGEHSYTRFESQPLNPFLLACSMYNVQYVHVDGCGTYHLHEYHYDHH